MKCEKHKVEMHETDCPVCHGDGAVNDDWQWPNETCYRCKGTGVAPYKICFDCEEEIQWADEQERERMDRHMNNGDVE